jgi:NodT family efflux transporter outer membrane factor (OMF) lipoprotein
MNRHKPSRIVISLALLTALLSACALTPDYHRPEVAIAPDWDQGSAPEAGEIVTADWWQRFGSDELDDLMQRAMAANHDLAAAVAAIEQARSSAHIASANRLPALDASASASRSQRNPGGGNSNDQALLNVGYELDLWGAAAAQSQAAQSRFAASVYDRDALALILQSEVAAHYFQTLALKDRLQIAQRNLAAARQVLELVEVRYREGAATGLELAQQRTSVLSIEAQIPQLDQQLRTTQHALAVLLGRSPQGFATTGSSLRELALPLIAAGQPAALLDRRPDIRRAEVRLIAANADIGVARAALYPGATLSASAGFSGLLTGGSGSLATIAASLVQSVFDGGRRQAQVDSTKAIRQQLVEQYAQAVLTALQDVQDSLVIVESSGQRAAMLVAASEQAQEAFRLATARYEAGAEDLLTLLDSQRTLLQSEDNLIQAQLARYTATTSLFKALGGGWMDTDPG